MKCSSVQKRLSAYQDGELKPAEQEAFNSHLLSCRSCREKYEQLERAWRSLEGLEQIRPEPWFYAQLVKRIERQGDHGLLPDLRRVFQFAGAPAIASVILVIGLAAGAYLGANLVRHGLFPSQSISARDSEHSFFASMRVFDPAPPGTFAEGYLRMASYEESWSR